MSEQLFEYGIRESAVRHGRIAAIFSLSNSASQAGATITGRIVGNVRCSMLWRRGGLAKRSVREQNTKNMPNTQQVSYFVLRLL